MFVALIVIFIIVVIIIVGTPILIFNTYYKLKTKGRKTAANSLLLVFISVSVFIGYEILKAIYPNDDLYKEYFQTNLGIDFPKDGQIIYKDAGYPDMHGDFILACSFELSPQSFRKYLSAFPPNSKYCNCGSAEIDQVINHYNKNNIIQVYKKTDGRSCDYVMFLNDNKTVIYFYLHNLCSAFK